ncbi:probable serine carboxypeptidase CPVL [Physella acuta]|uniref:probable serine carboxypeptidase CPVL n=1 Tax=Physella acuta TaxID=109671 RepID=UPI0027DCC3C0|nr:probable serine carboxypeptidase CPVL [Physella acuta]
MSSQAKKMFRRQLLSYVALLMIPPASALTHPEQITLAPPLMLSPLICKGQIQLAQEQSLVKDEKHLIPHSHAGFITVDEKLGNHLFFWFFPSTSGPESPLVVWLNGGPGNPSSLGLLNENGPIRPLNDSYASRIISWTQTMSMLYIDNPVGVGYSYSDSGVSGYRKDQDGYSKDLYEFIEQFYLLFPEYLNRDLYIGGKSYAGNYVLAFAHRLHLEIKAGRSIIRLAGIYIGGPSFDLHNQALASTDYWLATGAISKKQATEQKRRVVELFEEFKQNQFNFRSTDELYPRLIVHKGRVFYNFANNYYSGEPQVQTFAEVEGLMNSIPMRNLVHVGDREYLFIDSPVGSYLVQDFMSSSTSKLATLLEEKYKVLIYTGDLDALISPAMVDAALLSMKWSRRQEYQDSKRSVWWGGNGNDELFGFYSRVGNLCQVVIKGAGHSAGHDQPGRVFEMMNLFLQQGCIGV